MRLAVALLVLVAACNDAEPERRRPRPRRAPDAAPVAPALPPDGPPMARACDPAARTTCVADDVVACLRDGNLGVKIETCENGCSRGRCADPCETQGNELIYVVDRSSRLMSFDPRKLPDDPFAVVGTLACESDTTPFSMAVDNRGIAWVIYQSGNLYQVSILDAHCKPAGFSAGADTFGMGFMTDPDGAAADRLMVATGTELSRLDTTQTPPRKTRIAALAAGQKEAHGPELTGTGDAKLFGYFPDPGRKFVREIDPDTGNGLGPRLTVTGGAGEVRAWAFAHWGGSFYVFETTDDVGSSVYALHRGGGKTTRVLDHLPSPIVGAGVSTCAPALEAP